ncbi:hypothetical protein C8R45DRAFT_1069887, partial [Mycena sanguinolenta]
MQCWRQSETHSRTESQLQAAQIEAKSARDLFRGSRKIATTDIGGRRVQAELRSMMRQGRDEGKETGRGRGGRRKGKEEKRMRRSVTSHPHCLCSCSSSACLILPLPTATREVARPPRRVVAHIAWWREDLEAPSGERRRLANYEGKVEGRRNWEEENESWKKGKEDEKKRKRDRRTDPPIQNPRARGSGASSFSSLAKEFCDADEICAIAAEGPRRKRNECKSNERDKRRRGDIGNTRLVLRNRLQAIWKRTRLKCCNETNEGKVGGGSKDRYIPVLYLARHRGQQKERDECVVAIELPDIGMENSRDQHETQCWYPYAESQTIERHLATTKTDTHTLQLLAFPNPVPYSQSAHPFHRGTELVVMTGEAEEDRGCAREIYRKP